MPGLVPGIHDLPFQLTRQDVDGRDKPGHDVWREISEDPWEETAGRQRLSNRTTVPESPDFPDSNEE
jgi:hypothetical protein